MDLNTIFRVVSISQNLIWDPLSLETARAQCTCSERALLAGISQGTERFLPLSHGAVSHHSLLCMSLDSHKLRYHQFASKSANVYTTPGNTYETLDLLQINSSSPCQTSAKPIH